MLQRKILIVKGFETPDARRSGTVAVEKVAALAHEVCNLVQDFF